MAARKDLHSNHAERQRRADTVRAYREVYGDVCPGWGVAAHGAADLCADHVLGVGAGGSPTGELGVLCRSCNARKGKRTHVPTSVPDVRSRNWFS